MQFNPTKIRNEAEELIEKHLDTEKWSFHFSASNRYMGQCDPRDKTIMLSTFYVKYLSEYNIKQIILHEIAHAMVGTGMGHNFFWKAVAGAIGVDDPRATWCFEKEVNTQIIKELKPKFVMVAPDGEIVRNWSRSPSKKTWGKIKNCFVKGKRLATKGKMKIMPWNEYQRMYA